MNNSREQINLCKLYLMQDHGFVSKLNKRLWRAESQGPQSGPKPTNKNEGLHDDLMIALTFT